MVDLAIRHLDLAGGAQAVTAGVGNVQAGTQRGIQDGLTLFHVKGLTDGFDGELIAHDARLANSTDAGRPRK